MTWKDKNKQKEHSKRFSKRRWDKWRASGLCGKCGEPAADNRSYCPKHLKYQAVATIKYRNKKKWKE